MPGSSLFTFAVSFCARQRKDQRSLVVAGSFTLAAASIEGPAKFDTKSLARCYFCIRGGRCHRVFEKVAQSWTRGFFTTAPKRLHRSHLRTAEFCPAGRGLTSR
jgi:hypothetical protein